MALKPLPLPLHLPPHLSLLPRQLLPLLSIERLSALPNLELLLLLFLLLIIHKGANQFSLLPNLQLDLLLFLPLILHLDL